MENLKILNRLKPLNDITKLKENFYVLDVETQGLFARSEKFIFGCMYGHNYKKVFYSIKEYHEELFSGRFKHKYIFAHNAEYDFTVLFDNIKQNLDREAIFNGSSFICAKKDKVYFADSFNIYKTSVLKIGEMIGLPKLDLDNKFKDGISTNITHLDIQYCFRDCEIVYKALLNIFEFAQGVKPTLAGISMMYYKRFYMPHNFYYNEELCNSFFPAYYGGRVECFKIGKTFSYKYDVNSMYPYIMSVANFPNPRYLKESKKNTIEELLWALETREGYADIEVYHKKNNFGYLPFRHEGKLLFKNGMMRGSWCFPEIRLALKHKIIEIKHIFKIVHSYIMPSPFKKFSKELYKQRQTATGIKKENIKTISNSLYGKFGQRIKHREIYMDVLDIDLIETLQEKNIPYLIKNFNSERKDCYVHIFDQNKTKSNTIACFPAYITSLARCYLLEQMVKYKSYDITYCDTDCICVEKELPLVDSIELGMFKKEKEIITNLTGNKSYTQLLPDKTKKTKIKGIPKHSWQNVNSDSGFSENSYTFTRLIKTKQSIRNNLLSGMPIDVTKELKNVYTKRTVLKNGKTKPLQ